MGHVLALLLALGIASPALTPQQEQEARQLETMLIAPCCWSQQVAVHQSPAADEIRRDVRRRLASGQTREQIVDDYVVQFGQRILTVPPARGFNRLLYVLPPLALVGGAGLVIAVVRRFTGRTHERSAESTPAGAGPRETGNHYEQQLDEELDGLG
jgi:cytochrome c-type biogenesis protein CcmH